MIKCPLCEGNKINLIEIISKKKLIYLNKKLTGKDFSYLINCDINYYECKQCRLRFFYPLIPGDEAFYKSVQKFSWYYMDEKQEFLVARQYINKNDKVLEIGCGRGAFAKMLLNNYYVGLDVSLNAKLLAKKEGIIVENIPIEIYAELHPNQYDVVVSFQVLEHVAEPRLFLNSIKKTLKKEGKLILAVPCENSFLKYTTNAVLNMPPHHVTRWPNETLQFISTMFNLEIVGFHHEKLHEMHKSWYLSTIFENCLLSNVVVDLSLKRRIVSAIGYILSKILLKGLKKEMLPDGHTVIVIYKSI